MNRKHVLLFTGLFGLLLGSCRDQIDVPHNPASQSDSTYAVIYTATDGGTNTITLLDPPASSEQRQTAGMVCDVQGLNMLWQVTAAPHVDSNRTEWSGLRVLRLEDLKMARKPDVIEVANLSQPGAIISPKGDLIAYSMTNYLADPQPHGLHIMNRDGSGDRAISNNPDYYSQMCFSPDGAKLAFFSAPNPLTLQPEQWPDTLKVIDLGTGSTQVVTTVHRPIVGTALLTLSWSSKNVLAYRDGETVRTIGADGSNSRFIDNGAPESWSPDGKTLAYVTSPDGKQEDIMLTSDFGGTKSKLTNTPMASEGSVRWSPDGLKIICTPSPTGSTSWDWWLEEIDVASGSTQTLARDGGFGFYVQK